MIPGYVANTNISAPAFKGVFKDNKVLQKSLELASDYDVYHFGKNLERMNKVNDGRVFFLDKYYFTHPSVYREDVNLISYQNSKDFKSKTVGQSIAYHTKGNPDDCYVGVIEKVNSVLESIYPKKKVTRAKRENSIRRVNNNISK